jgi:hypothetical protein
MTVFTRAQLTDLVSTTRVKNHGQPCIITPTSVNTILQGFSAAYEHHTGIANADSFDDLLWCNLATLKKPSQTTGKRPLFAESANPRASQAKQVPLCESTLKKNLENCRSVLFAVIQHLHEAPNGDERAAPYKHAFDEFGTVCDELNVKQMELKLSGRLSARQEKNWRDWPELKHIETDVVLPYVHAALNGQNDDLNEHTIMETKKLQTYLLYLMYTLIPPARNNYALLRFVPESAASKLRVELSECPNYILVPNDGPMVLVLNAFKNDKRASADAYDPKECDFQLDHERTRRLVLDDDETLQTYGFDPKTLGTVLQKYRSLGLFRNRNPHELLFYDLTRKRKGQPAPPVLRLDKGAMKDRLTTLTRKLTATDERPGARIACQLFRTTFDTFLNSQEPTPADRLYIAKTMCHECSTQMTTYTKNCVPGNKRRHSSGQPKSKRPRPMAT